VEVILVKGMYMKDNEFYSTLFAGFFAGLMFFLLLNIVMPNSKINQYDAAIKECERSLPRDSTCKIIAVVE